VADRKPAPPIITEEHWQAILQAAAPLSAAADVERARREMEDCLREFDVLRQPPELVLKSKKPKEEWLGVNKLVTKNLSAMRKEWQQIDKLLTNLADGYYQLKRKTTWNVADPEWPQRNLLVLKPLRQQAEASIKDYDARLRARQARRDPARERLFRRLFEIWTDCFHGKLAVSTPAGGSPRGPLIRFIHAVLAPLTLSLWEGEPPSPETIRRLARSARRARKRQGSFQT
jgi:hypothetical protein